MFQYEPTKANEDVVAELASFTGTVTADTEHRFVTAYKTERVIEAGCNAHGRRKFRDAEVVQPQLATEGGALIAAMSRPRRTVENAGSSATRSRASPGAHPAEPLRLRKNGWTAASSARRVHLRVLRSASPRSRCGRRSAPPSRGRSRRCAATRPPARRC